MPLPPLSGESVDDVAVLGQAHGRGSGVSGKSLHATGVQGFGGQGTVSAFFTIFTAMGFLGGVDPVFKQSAGAYGESDQQGVMGLTSAPKGTGVYGGGTSATGGDQIGVRGETVTGVGVQGKSFGAGLAGKFIGDIEVTGDIRLTTGQDCAEEFDVLGAHDIDPGTVMVINEDGVLQQSDHEYDKKVAGVVSGAGDYRPGIVLGKCEALSNRLPIALLGKVYCKVDARFATVEVGDLLTTSPTPGHAMKATDPSRALGTLIGKALSRLEAGQGLIPILVALQ